jgi:hypothetical protein
MKIFGTSIHWRSLALAGILAVAASGSAIAQHAAAGAGGARLNGGAHQHFDGRFSHNQYYYDRGYSVGRLPGGGRGEFRGPDGGRYWMGGGNWYRWNGGGWMVWGAPIGLFLPYLPLYYSTVWLGGVPYYYANDTYYLWNDDQRQYQVVAPPEGIEAGGSIQTPASNQLFIYPKNGQSRDQQQKDQYECHHWAVGRSGFDPTVTGGGVSASEAAVKRDDYFRGQAACLEGRGYTVK